jgi:hypothetical protein
MCGSAAEPGDPGKSPKDPVRLALLAACGMFAAAFVTMIVITFAGLKVPDATALLDTCGWLVALTATSIVGIVTRGRS